MSKIIKTALLSYGMSGRVFHGPLLKVHPGFELVKIWERTKSESAALFDKKLIVRSFEEILNDKDINLVIVNTPDTTHFDLAKKALLAGKHVVVEKPFVTQVAQGEELISLANQQGLLLTVFQNRRWDGDFLTVRRVVEQNMLGRLVEYEAHFDRYRNFVQHGVWKETAAGGSGTVRNLGSHLIDQALSLFGKPQSVFADIRVMRTGGEVDDFFDIDLIYEKVKVKLRGSYLVREPGPRYILHGTKGSFLKWGTDPQEEMLKAGYLPDEPNWGMEEEKYWGTLNTSVNGLHWRGSLETLPGNYSTFYSNLLQAVSTGADLAVKPEESLLGIKIIEAAFESAQKGIRVKL